MEFSSTELFVEILIAGTLFAVGVSPLVALLIEDAMPRFKKAVPHAPGGHGVKPPELEAWTDLRPWMIGVVAVAFVYTLGVAGNRVVEVLYIETHIADETAPRATSGIVVNNGESIDKVYAKLEREVRNHGETYRDWVERHKSYRKILRAGSASSLMFFVSALIYLLFHEIVPRERPPFAKVRYCVIAIAFFGFFTRAYLMEDKHFKRYLVEYHSDFQPPISLGAINE